MSILDTIVAHKREEVAAKKRQVPVARLEDMPAFRRKALSLASVLRGKDIAVIAEIKQASPSKGVICRDMNPESIAREYVGAGAVAISVLTDEKFFLGKVEYMEQMRRPTPVPILRKDFIIDQYQLCEAKAYGADAVLLIAAILGPAQLTDLLAGAKSLGLECLVEVHREDEIDTLDMEMVETIGINNRDLDTFETDLFTSVRLRKHIPSDKIVVSESGISSGEDIEKLLSHGIHAFLIGESLMRAEHPGKVIAAILRRAGVW